MPLVKACLNGGTTRAEHPAVPLTPDELARDAAACVAAGAGALHFHVRDPEGLETLEPEPTAAALQAVRDACPGVPVGLTSGLWIAGEDPGRRLALIRSWTVRPDFVSVNLSEAGAPELAGALLEDGVGIEAGLFEENDADALGRATYAEFLLRVLIEPGDEDGPAAALERAAAIEARLDVAGVAAPHHSFGSVTWAVIDAALARGRDVRIGLEDTTVMPDGRTAAGNAELVAEAVRRAAA
jgi:uncharacterized protein (DUF849 family)